MYCSETIKPNPPLSHKSHSSNHSLLLKTASIWTQCSTFAYVVPEQSSKIPLVEHHSFIDVPVTYVWPVRQVPVDSQCPVIVYVLIQSLGLPVSPLNLNDNAFETPSYNGSFSGYSAVVVQLQGHPHIQVVDVTPDGW